ncbi:MAG: TonB-dependent receptor [bacterium]
MLTKSLTRSLAALVLSVYFATERPALSQTAPAVTGTISGAVRDREAKEGLPGVHVIIDGTTLGAATDLEGKFMIKAVPPGTYRVRASSIGYLPEVKTGVVVNANQNTALDFVLSQTSVEVPEVIVTASKRPQSFMETPASVSVVSARQIDQQNFATLDRMLEFTPGVNIMGGQINIRGSSGYSRGAGSRVQFLVDGVPMLPGDSGDIKWDALPPNEIERVEIVKGASSSLYGSNALGGVVNVITKDPTDKPLTAFRATAGLYDDPYFSEYTWTDRTLNFNKQDLTHSRTLGNLKIRASLGRSESTGFGENRHYHRFSTFTKAKYNFTPTTFATLYGNYARDRHGEVITWKSAKDPYQVAPESTGDVTTNYRLQLGGTLRAVLGKRATLKLRDSFYGNGFDNELADPEENPFCGTNSDVIHVRANKNDFEAQFDFEWNAQHASTAGVAGALDFIDATLYGDHEGRDFAGYVQHEWKPVPVFTATGSLRFDHRWVDTGVKEYHLNPRLGLVYQLSTRASLRASAGRGFRAPSMAEMFTCTRAGGFTVIPNQELSSEIAWSYEVGGQFILNPFLLNTALFWNDYDDFIEGTFVIKQSKSVIQFQNLSRARIRGAEVELNGGLWKKRLNFGVGYTYLDPRELEQRNPDGSVTAVDRPLAYRPKHLITGNLSLALGRYSLGFDSRYVSRIERVQVYPDDPRVSQKITNFRLGVTFQPVELTLNMYNLFRYSYTQVERNMEEMRSVSMTMAVALQ